MSVFPIEPATWTRHSVSAAVVFAGLVILWTGQQWVDPIMSLAVAVVILWSSIGLFKESVWMSLAGVPSVAAYRIPAIEGLIFRAVRRMHPVIKVRSIILANLVLGEWAIPEFVQRQCTAENLAAALIDILPETPARARQIEAFERLEAVLGVGSMAPSKRAAQAVLDLIARKSESRA